MREDEVMAKAYSNVCPCKGCTAETGRSITCHSSCTKYLEWKASGIEIPQKEPMSSSNVSMARKYHWRSN